MIKIFEDQQKKKPPFVKVWRSNEANAKSKIGMLLLYQIRSRKPNIITAFWKMDYQNGSYEIIDRDWAAPAICAAQSRPKYPSPHFVHHIRPSHTAGALRVAQGKGGG
jgi:hypothetical protein